MKLMNIHSEYAFLRHLGTLALQMIVAMVFHSANFLKTNFFDICQGGWQNLRNFLEVHFLKIWNNVELANEVYAYTDKK